MLEQLIKDLDSRGLLILQIMLGKRAMELLQEPKSALLTDKSTILHASNTRTPSITTTSQGKE